MSNARTQLVFLCVLICTANNSFAASYLLTGLVDQRNVPSGEPSYDFLLSLSRIFSTAGENVEIAMVSPLGIRFGESTNDSVRVDLDDIQPANLDNVVSGAWTIEETVNGGGLNRYEFTVPQILNSPSFVTPPIIAAPIDGSTVDKVFDLIYSNPLPNSFGYKIIYADSSLQGNFPIRQINSPGNVTLSFADIPGISGATISRFSVSNQVNNRNVLTPTPLNLGANSRFDQLNLLAGLLSFNTNSPPISFTIVPEPNSILMLVIGGLSTLAGRSFRKTGLLVRRS